jgi:two-component system NtrC family response regulator
MATPVSERVSGIGAEEWTEGAARARPEPPRLAGGGAASPRLPDVGPLHRLLGATPAMQALYDRIRRFSTVEAPVLILGERGTGKGLAARCLHDLWGAGIAELFSVNCSAVPEALAESELFGHRRGAFTGATGDRDGLLLTAFRRRGGLLLDDLPELPPAVQPKLLHAVEERVFYPLGSDQVVSIANGSGRGLRMYATSQPASLLKLRPDLRDRLSTCVLELPPLRERGSDILLIAPERVRTLTPPGGPRRALAEDAAAVLLSYEWPGNVRQLYNVLDRALALGGESPQVTAGVLGQCLDDEFNLERLSREAVALEPRVPHGGDGFLTLREAEARHIQAALDATAGNVAHAARLLGLKRTTLQSRLRHSAIAPSD